MCRCTMAGEKTTKPTFGNIAGQPDQWSSTFEWVVNEKGPNGSWVTSRASSKVTVTGLTIMSAEPESSTRRAGRIIWRAFLFGMKAEVADWPSRIGCGGLQIKRCCSKGLEKRQQASLWLPRLGSCGLDLGMLPKSIQRISLHLQIGSNVPSGGRHTRMAEIVANDGDVGA